MRRSITAVAASSMLLAGCGGASGAANTPFTWDGGADSAACAVHACLSYVTNLCPAQPMSDCAGSSQQLTSNAIVIRACYKDGSKQVLTQYAASIDIALFAPGGAECLHEQSDLSGVTVIEDPAGRNLARLDFHSLNDFTCGGVHSDSFACPDAGTINLVQLSGCEGSPGTCQ
jgi:hypothetical protein